MKPDKILVHEGTVTIIDFNVATTNKMIKGGTGVKEWSAPETRSGVTYSLESDVWSLGCLLYFMVTKDKPC